MQAQQVVYVIVVAGGSQELTTGIPADSAGHVGAFLAAVYQRRHPDVSVHASGLELCGPTAGLRLGLVDVAITHASFDEAGLTIRVLGADQVSVVLVDDDPLAGRETVGLDDLAGCTRFRFPEGTDEA